MRPWHVTPLLLLAIAACGQRQTDTAMHADATQVPCAPGGDAAFDKTCSVDRQSDASGLILIVNNPDGGFHRLRVTSDGRGVVAADGAQPAKVTVIDPGHIEIAIGNDRYRLPAHMKGSARS